MELPSVITRLQGGLIVSCQYQPGDGIAGPEMMAAMARAAALGGAVGIRANGPDDIAAIRATVDLPIIGIEKQVLPDFGLRITPSFEAARRLVEAGADIVALDATLRPRPGDLDAATLIRRVRQELGVPVMADISTFEEGMAAAEAGADLVATTLSGYTPYSPQLQTPDFDLVARLASAIRTPVVSEGRIATPREAVRMLELGAYAVVVGSMVNRPKWITQHYVAALHARTAEHRALAVDIGGTKIAAGVVSDGRVERYRQIPTQAEEGGPAVLARTLRLLEELFQETEAEPPSVVGISAAGQVDASGHIFYATGLLPGWAGVPLKREVEAHFGRPTAVLSDGHAAALGEAWYGAGRGRSSVLCLTVGTGVGGGMVVDGEVYRGAWGAAGIVGHTKVVRDGLPCTCGGQGCLESYVSGPALVREYNARVAGQPALNDGRAVVERARAGDPAAREALATIGAWLGFGLASLLGALNPEVVVIGGGVSQASDLLLESARESLRTYGFPTVKETPILPAELGPQAGLVGAAVLAHQQKTR